MTERISIPRRKPDRSFGSGDVGLGHECHGFEIELEDMHSSDVSYTFGGSYSRYGSPQVVEDLSDPAHPRVIVRYQKWNGSQWEATPMAPVAITPSGHDCFQGGSVGNYLSSGCEHYGVSLRANPTLTTYRWLVAAAPGDVNSAFGVAPEAVKLPVPVWSVGVGANGGVAVRADVEPLEVEAVERFGEPQWLRVWKVESDLDLQPEDLNRLLLGLADGIVPQDDTEIETEWKIIQAIPPGEPGEDADIREEELAPGNQAVVRRYEFYAYTGPLDPETNEVMPCIADDSPVPDAEPVDGCSDSASSSGHRTRRSTSRGSGPPSTNVRTTPTRSIRASAAAACRTPIRTGTVPRTASTPARRTRPRWTRAPVAAAWKTPTPMRTPWRTASSRSAPT